jgi:hypothetical protein
MSAMDKPEEQYIEDGVSDRVSNKIGSRTDPKKPKEDAIAAAHRNFLMKRHGTIDLDPMPSMDEADPLNWPKRKV